MKLLLLPLFLFALHGNAQITNPFPYCTHEYDGGTVFKEHYISEVQIGSFTNVTGSMPWPFPHYVFYNNLAPIQLVMNQTYNLTIIADTTGYKQAQLWVDWDRDVIMESDEWIFIDSLAPGDSIASTYLTVPVMAAGGLSRMRITLYEDNAQNPSITSCATWLDWGETEDYEVLVSLTAGVDQPHAESLSLFPNPFTNGIQIHTESPMKRVRVYDQTLRLLFEEYQSGNTSATLNLPKLHTGSYMVSVLFDDGRESIKRMVKME